jgi:hypothetical protein
MDYQTELRRRVISAGALTSVLAFAALGAAVSTFFGIKSLIATSDIEGTVIPAVSAAVVGVGLFCIWHRIATLVPMLQSPGRQALGIGLATTVSLVTILTSSWFIATTIGGVRAVQAYMNDYIAHTNTRLGHAVLNFSEEQSLIPSIQNFAAGWRVQAKSEASQGIISGHSGSGPLVATLDGAAAELEKLGVNMRRTRTEFLGLQEQAESLLADLSKIANALEAASPASQARFSETAGRFFQKLREMERLSLLPQVKLGGVAVLTTPTSGSIADSINTIQATLHKQTRELHAAVKKIEASRQSVDDIPYIPTNRGMATWEFANAVPGAWLVGIGIDLLPFLVLLLLMLTHSEARQPYLERVPSSVVSGVRDLRNAG